MARSTTITQDALQWYNSMNPQSRYTLKDGSTFSKCDITPLVENVFCTDISVDKGLELLLNHFDLLKHVVLLKSQTFIKWVTSGCGIPYKKIDPFNDIPGDKTYIFLPVCDKSHWTLLVGNIPKKTVTLYDSIRNYNRLKKHTSLWVKCVKNGENWTVCDDGLRNSFLQLDTVSCGIVTIIHAHTILIQSGVSSRNVNDKELCDYKNILFNLFTENVIDNGSLIMTPVPNVDITTPLPGADDIKITIHEYLKEILKIVDVVIGVRDEYTNVLNMITEVLDNDTEDADIKINAIKNILEKSDCIELDERSPYRSKGLNVEDKLGKLETDLKDQLEKSNYELNRVCKQIINNTNDVIYLQIYYNDKIIIKILRVQNFLKCNQNRISSTDVLKSITNLAKYDTKTIRAKTRPSE